MTHMPSFRTAFAASEEDVRAAQRLRYDVFVRELGSAGPMVDHAAGLERDRFDAFNDHLLLFDDARDAATGQVVGVYRLLDSAQAEAAGTTTLINCASQEYFGAVDLAALKPQVITPVFMEDKPAGPKVISFFAKQARGAMARFIIQRRLTDPSGLKDFDLGGYVFRDDMSSPEKPVFVRPEEATKTAA